MKVNKYAKAGTLESNDCLIQIRPADTLDISIKSDVYDQFKDQILAVMKEVLEKEGIDKAQLSIEDKGALDCTIKARLQTAIRRSNE